MSNENEILRIDHERRTRSTFGIVAVAFGLILLCISMTSSWGPRERNSDGSDLATLVLTFTSVTIVAALANLFRTRILFGAVVQATFSFATLVSVILFALSSHIDALGPSAIANILGCLLIAMGGIARINGQIEESVQLLDKGRKYVYRDNRVVAIEQWLDGKLVSTQPVVPTIAR